MTTILNFDFQVYEVHIIIMYMWFVIAIIYINLILLHDGERNIQNLFLQEKSYFLGGLLFIITYNIHDTLFQVLITCKGTS